MSTEITPPPSPQWVAAEELVAQNDSLSECVMVLIRDLMPTDEAERNDYLKVLEFRAQVEADSVAPLILGAWNTYVEERASEVED